MRGKVESDRLLAAERVVGRDLAVFVLERPAEEIGNGRHSQRAVVRVSLSVSELLVVFCKRARARTLLTTTFPGSGQEYK